MRRPSARLALAVTTGIMAALALAAPAAAAEQATFTGTVTHPSGAPAQNVWVYVQDPETGISESFTTDADGVYTTAVEPGTYQIYFQWHYLTQWAPQKLTQDEASTFTVAAGQTVRADEQLLPTGSLSGRITHADGSPLQWRYVTAVADDLDVAVSTDENGVYSFDGLLTGDYQVRSQPPSGMQWVPGAIRRADAATFTVRAGQHITVNDTLLAPATLNGRLTDSQGRPLASYAVHVEASSPDDGTTFYDRTDQNGHWSITDMRPGSYRVRFAETPESQDAGQWADTVVTAAPGETATLDYTWLPATTLVVKAVDAVTGAPVPDFCVLVENQNNPRTCSDTVGSATITTLPATSHTFEVEPSSTSYHLRRRGLSATLSPDQVTTVTVPLDQGGKVAVTATDRATGQAVPGACFVLKAIGRPDTFGAGCTNAQGRVTTEQAVTPGTYEAFVQAPGDYGHQWLGPAGGTGDQQAAARIVVKPGRTTKAPAVLLDPAGTITGVVTGLNGLPVDQVKVGIEANNNYASGNGRPGVLTDAAGRYTLGKLGPYAWPLLFTTYGYPDQWSGNGGNRFTAVDIPVTSGSTATYDMKLTHSSVLRGTITPATGELRLFAHNAATGDLVGVFHEWNGVITSYDLPLAGGQQVKLQWDIHGDSTTQTWHANATDISTATKIGIPPSGVKRLNLTHP